MRYLWLPHGEVQVVYEYKASRNENENNTDRKLYTDSLAPTYNPETYAEYIPAAELAQRNHIPLVYTKALKYIDQGIHSLWQYNTGSK